MWGKEYLHTVGARLIQPFWCVFCNIHLKMCIYLDPTIQFTQESEVDTKILPHYL